MQRAHQEPKAQPGKTVDGHALIFRPLKLPRLGGEENRAPPLEHEEVAAVPPRAVEEGATVPPELQLEASQPATAAAEDARLVNAVRRGDSRAFDQLVRRHLAVAHRVALRVLDDVHDAQDACQDAFIQALTHIETCERPEAFRSWLLTIVRNRAYNLVKARRVRTAEPLEAVEGSVPGGDDPSRSAYRGEVRDRIEGALVDLTEIQRNVIVMFDGEGWTHREIGERLGISEGSSRVHLHVARAKLRERLGVLNPFGGGDEPRG
jgi:RNA polymerase sigma-70 factor (ECF subfamily)